MQFTNLFQQVIERTGLAPKPELSGLPEILDDNFRDTEALIISPPFTAQHEQSTGYIAVVGASASSLLDSNPLFGARQEETRGVRALALPENPHAAMGLLMELENAGLIVFVLESHERLSSKHLRWLAQLQVIKVPRVVVINGAEHVKVQVLSKMLDALHQRLKLPVVPIYGDDPERTRTLFIETLFGVSPRLAATTARQAPSLRPILVHHLVNDAAHDSLELDSQPGLGAEMSPLSKAQVRLVQQLKAVYGKGGQLSEQENHSMLTLAVTATHYAGHLIASFPTRDGKRRARVASGVSTLLLGYLVMVFHGETPPDIRAQVVPQIWRLYRASGQMANS